MLTLTELEAATSLRLTGLLTLNLTAVTCQETGVLELLLVLFVHLDKGAGDSHAQGLALASETAPSRFTLMSYFSATSSRRSGCFSPYSRIAEDTKNPKDAGFLTRDSREVERKKPGQPKAIDINQYK